MIANYFRRMKQTLKMIKLQDMEKRVLLLILIPFSTSLKKAVIILSGKIFPSVQFKERKITVSIFVTVVI